MTLEQLRVFIAVAEREHVTQAAQSLGLTQSAVSNALAALESRHAVRLLDRIGRGVRLSEVGRAFLPEARQVLARAEAAEATLADLSALRRGRLGIFASQTIASYWLPPRLVRFHLHHPGVEIDLSIGNTREATAAVLEGMAELGFVEGAFDAPALSQEAVGSDRLVVLAPPGHPVLDAGAFRVGDLLGHPWVLREVGSGTRSSLEAALRNAGLDPGELAIAMSLPSNEAVLAAAEAGAGLTALSENVAAAALAAGRLAVAPFNLGERVFRLLRHRQRYATRAGEAFTALLQA